MKILNAHKNKREYKAYCDLKAPIDKYKTLRIDVEYFIGGVNYFSGSYAPRGYRVSMKPCNVGGMFEESTLLSNDKKHSGGYIMVETTNRFNAKRLSELAEMLDPQISAIVAAYEEDDIEKLTKLIAIGKIENKVTIKPQPIPGMNPIITEEIKERLPKLYSQEDKKPEDVKVIVKFFDPTGNWTWYATEGEKIGTIEEGAFKDQDDYRFFGFVQGIENELGYFTLSELSTAKSRSTGIRGLPIERDIHFGFGHSLAEVMK